MKYLLVVLVYLYIPSLSKAQQNYWHFGNGVTFIFQGKELKLSFNENLAIDEIKRESFSIQDKNGNLKFYTDGISIWNQHDKLIDDTLLGELSVVGAPHPTVENLYYLFYVGNNKAPKSYKVANKVNYKALTPADTVSDNRLTMLNTKLYYALIDLKKEKIIEKNVILAESILSNCCILRHKNRNDYWIISHDFKTNQFRTFLLDDKGINKIPILSKMGKSYIKNTYKIIRWELALYYMKGNVYGDMLYINTQFENDKMDIFKFDNEFGKVIDFREFKSEKKMYYPFHSFEFSPNRKYIYKIQSHGGSNINTVSSIEQYAINHVDSLNSITLIKKIILPNHKLLMHSQLAPNGNIYITSTSEGGMTTITKPNDSLDLKNIIFDEVALPEDKQFAGKMPKINHLLPIEDEIHKPMIKKNIPFTREILFETNQAILKPEYETELQDIVDFLKQNPNSTIEISGHTDNEGEETKNKTLSENRAKSLANFLIKNKIEATRIKAIGYGSAKPIAENTTPEGKAKNRRIEFLITDKK